MQHHTLSILVSECSPGGTAKVNRLDALDKRMNEALAGCLRLLRSDVWAFVLRGPPAESGQAREVPRRGAERMWC